MSDWKIERDGLSLNCSKKNIVFVWDIPNRSYAIFRINEQTRSRERLLETGSTPRMPLQEFLKGYMEKMYLE